MRLHRFLVSILVLLAFSVLSCDQKGTGVTAGTSTTPTAQVVGTAWPLEPPIPRGQEPYLLKAKPGHKWIASRIVTTKKLLPCPAPEEKPGPVGAQPAPPEPATGAFVCSRVWRVELLVKQGDDTVYVTPPDKLKVEVGDCVLWETKTEAGDTNPAGIALVKFYDSESDIPAGKAPGLQKNANMIGRGFCKTNQVLCAMRFDLAVGTYGYKVVVRHENKDKMTDPETEVSCTGCDQPSLTGGGS